MLLFSKTLFKVRIGKSPKVLYVFVRMQYRNVRQSHAIEGVIFTHRIDRHIAEQEEISLLQGRGEAIISDHISGQTGRPAQTDAAGQRSGSSAPYSGGR